MNNILKKLERIPIVIKYGLILSAGLIVIKTIEYHLYSFKFSIEVYSSLIALFFLLLGAATAYGLLKKSTQDTPENNTIEPLTTQERAMLQGLVNGLSNQALADANHVSVNTIKTHLKSLYRKLSVSSRAQAVAKSRELHLISQ